MSEPSLAAASETPVKFDTEQPDPTPVQFDQSQADKPVDPTPEKFGPETFTAATGDAVKFTPEDIRKSDDHLKYTGMMESGVQPFQSDTPTDDDIGYAKWLRDNGHLKNPDGPGFWHTVGDVVASTAKGVPEVFGEAYRYRMAMDFGTDAEKKQALAREEAFSAETVNKIKSMYEAMGAGAQRLVGKGLNAVASTLAELESDPAFKAQFQKADDKNWYGFMRKMTLISREQQMVHDEAARIAIDNGWSAEGLKNATETAMFAADPGQLAMGGAMGLAGKGISAGLRAVGIGGETAALGAADALRAEVMQGAARMTSLEKTVARTSKINTKDGVAMYQFWNGELANLAKQQATKEAALKALDESNAKILAGMGRPGILGRAAGRVTSAVGETTENAGKFFSEWNQSIVDSVVNAAGKDAPKAVVSGLERAAPTAIAGGLVGAAMSDDTTGGFIKGAAAGAMAPGTVAYAGRIARILGENYLIGRTTVPYFARMATDAEANSVDRWFFRQFDKFTPAVSFAREAAKTTAKSAGVGAGLGYVTAGGEDTDLTEAAAAGVAGHYTPWAFASSLHGFWKPVRTPAEYQAMQAANVRLLRERWAGSENLSRFEKLNPNSQVAVASVLSANPDTILRLVGTDDAVIKADQLARGQVPNEGYRNMPGFHYKDPVSGRSVIVLNPEHPDSVRPVVAHEFIHKAQAEGIAQSIVTELIGDEGVGLPGMYTEKGADGKAVTNPDGTFKTTAEFANAKREYVRRLLQGGVRVDPTLDEPMGINFKTDAEYKAAHDKWVEVQANSYSNAEFALEHAAEQGADFILSNKFEDAMRPTVGSLVMNLMPEAVRNAVGTTGSALNADGSVRGTMNLGLKPSPGVEKLIKAYMADWRVGRNKEAEAGARNVEITREQILKNPEILDAFRTSSSLNVDPRTGKIAGTEINATTGKLEITDIKKVFKSAAQMAKEQAQLTEMVMEAVRNAKDTAADKDAVRITMDGGREVAMGRYLSDETLAWIENSGRFNAFQLEHVKNLNALTKAGTGNHVRFFYQPALKGDKYASLRGHWREEVPYSWHISKAENILFRTVSYDKVAKNLDRLWEMHPDRAQTLWSSQVSMKADAKTYLGNLSGGREGKTGLSEAKRDFLNVALGINTSNREDVNPLFSSSAHRRLESFVTARRIDRTNRITLPVNGDNLPWSYDAYSRGRENFTSGEREMGRNADFAKPPTDEEAINALSSDKKKWFGQARSLPEGTPVGLRIDIPAYNKHGVYVVTVHEPATPSNVGDRIGYDTVARVSDPKFFVKEGDQTSDLGAQAIKEGRAKKHPIATVEGTFNPSREIPSDIKNWTPVGFDPKDHSYFYDKRTDQPVTGGKEAVSVGNSVFVREPVYGSKSDFRYSAGNVRRIDESDIQYTPGSGNKDTQKVAEDYVRSAFGRPYAPHTNYDEAPEAKLRQIADYFQNEAKHDPSNPEVKRSYEALADETLAQYKAMTDAGIKIEPYEGKGEPYGSSAEMMKDVQDNKHLYFLRTEGNFGNDENDLARVDQPLLKKSGVTINGHDLLVNDVFRAVHDYFGHTQQGYQFGPRGEFNAWRSHSKMYSEAAQGAVAAETLAQNAWVNFGKHLRREDGSIPKKGEQGYVPPQERPFGEQKNFVVPSEMMQFSAGDEEKLQPRPRLVGGRREPIKANGISYENIAIGKTDKSLSKVVLENKPTELFDRIDGAKKKIADDPMRLADERGWTEYFRDAGVWGDVLTAPPALRMLLERPKEYVDLLNGGYHGRLTKPGTMEAADAGLDATVEMRAAIKGRPPEMITAMHHLWGILSRMLPPVEQESAWLRLISDRGVLEQIQNSIDGSFSLTQDQWKATVSKAMAATNEASGGRGNQGTANANAFYLMLSNWNGMWNRVSDVYTAETSTESGRNFWSLNAGPVGIKNKVQRFIGLTFGIPGLIMDRWKFVEFYHQQYGKAPQDYFKYSAFGTPEDPNGIYGAYGTIEGGNSAFSLAFYEGLESVLNRAIANSPELMDALGRHANLGGLHWKGWNAIKNEAVGHSSLDLTYDLALRGKNPSIDDVLDQVSRKDYYTEGLVGNRIVRFTLPK